LNSFFKLQSLKYYFTFIFVFQGHVFYLFSLRTLQRKSYIIT
jgi:hypothetical protein